MFSKAYEIASEFTHPVIISTRHFDGSVQCGCGAFVIVNSDGWIVTASHIIETFLIHQKHKNEIEAYTDQVKKIKNNPKLDRKQKNRSIKKIKTNPKWITNHSFWWGQDGLSIQGNIIALPAGDIAVGKLSPFDGSKVNQYPVFKNPKELKIGTSLCKLGFPFHEINATFDENTGNFQLAPDTLPLPRFPIEGIYTRNANIKKDPKSPIAAKFIETSSPGLRGQSGGPIFDVNGTIWGIQSQTINLPLGFSQKIKRGKTFVEENQFLNVGLGSHPETIVKVFENNKIDFHMSDY